MTTVYDLNGQQRDLAWLTENYDGCTVLPAPAAGASDVWRLEAILVTEGPAVLKIEARIGSVQAVNQPVVVTWPDLQAPSPELETLPASPHNWSSRGVISRTGPDGVYGAGLGSTFGPFYHTYIAGSAPSDCLTKTGMKGGTNHCGPLHGVWVLQPVAPDPNDDLMTKVREIHSDLKSLMQHLGAL